MPVLDVGAWSDNLYDQWRMSTQVLKIMHSPGDPLAQDAWLAYEIVRIGAGPLQGARDIADALRSDLMERQFYPALARAFATGDMARWVHQTSLNGIMAGDILGVVLRLDEHDGGGSVEMAYALLMDVYRHEKTPWGQDVPASRASLSGAWSAARTVAHLWLAFRALLDTFLLATQSAPPAGVPQLQQAAIQQFRQQVFSAEFPTFAATAEAYRQRAATHIPTNGRKIPLLTLEETWRVHLTSPLPDVTLTFEPVDRSLQTRPTQRNQRS